MLAILPTPRESVPREMCPPCLALTLGARQTVRAFGGALDAFMVRVKELDGVLLQLVRVIGDGMAPPEQLSRFQRLIVDATTLAKVRTATCPGPRVPSCEWDPHAAVAPSRILAPMRVSSVSRCTDDSQPRFCFLLLQRLEARWTVTKILMASADTATLAALDTELSACLLDMQVFQVVACAQRVTVDPRSPVVVCGCGVSVRPARASLGRPSKRLRKVRASAPHA
jgi:hypothetical protein